MLEILLMLLNFSIRTQIFARQLSTLEWCPGLDWYEFGDFCYKPSMDKKTWHDAQKACRTVGAELVSILSITEPLTKHTSDVWTGLNDLEFTGYSWSDGTPLSHTNWGHGEPNNHEGREDCVEMVSSTNGTISWWNDLNCDAHQDWICMITKGKTPILPPVPLLRYQVYSGKTTMFGIANGQYMYAMMFVLVFCSLIMYNTNAFSFKRWVDFSPVSYTHWSPGEPNNANGEEQCVQMNRHQGKLYRFHVTLYILFKKFQMVLAT
uniref:C-type lectin domain-containing protein n=1 Tax=Neogobius melanostomus TaxID=47308 RepID=A0A8C6S6N5_9GOBI